MSKITNHSYAHKNEPVVIIITANDAKEADEIFSSLVKDPKAWRLDEISTVSDK